MDDSGNTQSRGSQSSSSIESSKTDSETRKEYQESGDIQEAEKRIGYEQETKEEKRNDKYNLNSNTDKCNLDSNIRCANTNGVYCQKAFTGGCCELVNETGSLPKSNIHLLKRCSVVLNRCDEKTPKGGSLTDGKHKITCPVNARNARLGVEKYLNLRKNIVDPAAFVTMGPENEYKRMDSMEVEEISNEKCTQMSNCEGTSSNSRKHVSIQSVKSAQNECNCTEISENRLENYSVLSDSKRSSGELRRFHWKYKNSIVGSDQVSKINSSEKDRKNKNKTFTPDSKSGQTFAKPEKPIEPTSRHKVTSRRSSRNVKKQICHEEFDDSDITEILPSDPLLPDLPSQNLLNMKKTGKLENTKNTIVVNNTEQLLQIASGKGIKRKKEPTLVIIDTNSILSGKGPVPISQISLTGPLSQSSVISGYSVLPSISGSWNNIASGSSTQTVLQSLNHLTFSQSDKSNTSCTQISPLTANAVYVISPPSFIVPRLYEQPPKQSLKKYIEQLQREIEIPESTSKSVGTKDNSKNGVNNYNEDNSKPRQNKKKKHDESDDPIDESHSSVNCKIKTNDILDDEKVSTHCNGNANNKNSNCSLDTPMRDITKGDKRSGTNDQEFFTSTLGTFFIQIGLSLVKEYVKTDLEHIAKEDQTKLVGKAKHNQFPHNDLEYRVEDNQPFHFRQKKCGYCNFQTESCLVLSHHLEIPHSFNNVYKCNFCNLMIENRSKIVYHMIMAHEMRVLLECAPAHHQCPNCPFEDNNKAKLNCHMVSCLRKHKPNRNQEPPTNWEPPAKIRHIVHNPVPKRGKSTSSYQMTSKGVRQLLPKLPSNSMFHAGISAGQHIVAASRDQVGVIQSRKSTSKQIPMTGMWQRPNISITPLPNLQTLKSSAAIASQGNSVSVLNKVQKLNICEICNAHFMDFGDLQIHLRDIHQVKFSKKATYSTPSLGCQKCPLRFFTDQGLERHLLGTHGLVTASFQEAARNETDGGHCPICAKLFQWKLLEHMYREHKMSLKPVNISYKCTLCSTVTFEKYKQFEDHVFAMHSLSKSKKNSAMPPAPLSGDILKSLKKNNEITIISHDKQSDPKNSSKTSDVISLIQQGKKLENVKIQQLETKDNIEGLEGNEHLTKENKTSVTPEEINIDSSYEEDKHMDKDPIGNENLEKEISEDKIEHNCVKGKSNDSYESEKLAENYLSKDGRNNGTSEHNNKYGDAFTPSSTDKTEHNSLKDQSNDSHESDKLADNYLSKDGRNNGTSELNNKYEDTFASSSTASEVDLSQKAVYETLGENGKVCTFFKSQSLIQCGKEIEDNEKTSTSKETSYQQEDNGNSSTNKCETLNNFSHNALGRDIIEKKFLKIICQNDVSAPESKLDDSASANNNKGGECLPQQKMRCQSVDGYKKHQCVEFINLDEPPENEKNSLKEKNSEISENSTSINNQNENQLVKNSENCIFEEQKTEEDTFNSTNKYKTLQNEPILPLRELVDTNILPKHNPSIPKINTENKTESAENIPRDVDGNEVIQSYDSFREDKREIEKSDNILSNNEIN